MKSNACVAIVTLVFIMVRCLEISVHGEEIVLSIEREGSNVIVSFVGQLQSASQAEGPYTNVLGTTSPFLWPVLAGAQQFWRSATAGGGTFSAGDSFTVALKNDGSSASWGFNNAGQLGTPGPADWISVACGFFHTLALTANGTLWAWGGNFCGQLGIGNNDSEPHHQPAQVGLDADWASVACSYSHTMALKANGTLWAWGDNRYGQLGIGAIDHTNQPARVGIDTDWQAVAFGGYPDEIWLCGPGHTVGLKTDGSMWAWGSNWAGQLGIGSNDSTNQPTRVGMDAEWQAVACGSEHTVALKANGTLLAWGHNRDGQLGIGTFEDSNQPVQVGSDTNWIRVACGTSHTIALKANGILWAWGNNRYGQLGGGTFAKTNQPVQIGSDTDWAR